MVVKKDMSGLYVPPMVRNGGAIGLNLAKYRGETAPVVMAA